MARRNLVAVVLLVAVIVGGIGSLIVLRDDEPAERLCTMEGVLGPDGEVYGRDPKHDCRFVDDEGRPIFPGT